MTWDPEFRPCLKDPPNYENEVRAAKAEYFDAKEKDILRERGNKKSKQYWEVRRKNKLQANRRMAKLWKVLAPKLVVVGIKLETWEASEAGISSGLCDVSTEGTMLVNNTEDICKALKYIWGEKSSPHWETSMLKMRRTLCVNIWMGLVGTGQAAPFHQSTLSLNTSSAFVTLLLDLMASRMLHGSILPSSLRRTFCS